MENSQSLIRKARAFESAGQDEGALGCYLQALATDEGGGDANLLARAGALQLRLARTDEAAETLGRASDLYNEAGLRNIALALCHRVLRVDAARPDFLRRLAEISAAQGYRDDARRGVMEFASAVEDAQADTAAAALRAYLAHFPDDAVVKQRLAALTGEELPAAPSAPVAPPRPSTDAPRSAPVEDFGLVPSLSDDDDSASSEDDPLPVLSTQPTSSSRESNPGIVPLEGLETTHSGETWAPAGGGDENLGLMDNGLEPTSAGPGRGAPADFSGPSLLDPPDADDVDTVDAALESVPVFEAGDDVDDEPLPFLVPEPVAAAPARPAAPPSDLVVDQPADPEAPPPDPEAELRERIAHDPTDLSAHEALVDRLSLHSDERLEDALAAAHAAFARAGQHAAAADYAERLANLRPDDSAALQAWAEHAFRSGDRTRLVAAYLAVARRFGAAGQAEPARKIYERVLKLDPANQEAREASGEYVDIGALVRDDEASTRFRIEASFPTGDEEEDFQEILASFREQITAGIDASDSASHYDLGIAFKEMGLWDDAVTQLQRALRAGSSPLATMEMLGECYCEKNEYELAARVLERAAALPGPSSADLAGVHYWLGRAHEALGAVALARESYTRVSTVDPAFRDVADRLEAFGAA